MTRMTAGEAIVAMLRVHGIDTVFGLPGAQIYGLFDALAREPAIRVVGARHEQGCGYMALGYARSTGRPSAYAVVPGPGVLNTGAALLTAFGGNEQVLCLTGQVPTPFLEKRRGHLHEMPDQLAVLRGIAKWADRMATPAEVPGRMAEAFRQMGSGRRGPAALETPWDVFTEEGDVALAEPSPLDPPPAPHMKQVEHAASLVAAARAPMIFVGSGAIEARAEVRALAERLGAPVVAFRSGRGIVGDDEPLGMTMASAYRLWPGCDLAIGVGTRMELPGWRWSWRPEGLKTVRVDIDPAEFERLSVDGPILADAAEGTRALIEALPKGLAAADRRAEIAEAKAAAEIEIQEIQPQFTYLRALRDVLPRDSFVTDELSQAGFASWFAFPVYEPRTYVSSGYQGTLGAGFPTALGVKVAHPDKPVVAICGDGGFMFAVQELSTAVQFGIGTVALVFNNRGYGNVRRDQIESFGGRIIASDLENPDFMKLAEAFGVRGARVQDPAALRKVLETAFQDGGPWLIEVPLEPGQESNPWRFIHPPPP